MNSEEITMLLILLKDFKDSFDVTLRDWATEPVELDLKLIPNRLIVYSTRSLESESKHSEKILND